MIETQNLSVGEWVQVRTKVEILATLDQRGCLDELPFMPEMFQFCGQRFQIWKRAHKTCDTVNKTGGRRMVNAVHLQELRCDGKAHGGCQAGCLLYWKLAWLKPVSASGEVSVPSAVDPVRDNPTKAICTEENVVAATFREGTDQNDPSYICQTTQLPKATTLLAWYDVRQYWEDWRSGNATLGRISASFLFVVYYKLVQSGIGLGSALRRFYDWFQKRRGGVPYPRRPGLIPDGQPTPEQVLNLQPGESVRVKTHPQILATLTENNRNRGLYFDCEEVPYCGGTYRVRSRVSRIINEQTGKMMNFKTASVILEGVYCQARYSDKRLFCPRAIYPMWREIWLERVNDAKPEQK